AGVGEGAEHGGGDARRVEHAGTDHRDLGNVGGGLVAVGTDGVGDVADQLLGGSQVRGGDGEGEVGGAVVTDVLEDDVDVDVMLRQRPEDGGGDAGTIRHAQQGDLGDIGLVRDAAHLLPIF